MRYCATIGFFDGVHRGHRLVLERLKSLAAERGMPTMVITFANHPMSVINPDAQPQQLCTVAEKRERLLREGIDRVEMLEFSEDMMLTSARDFMAHTLHNTLGVNLLMLGYDNRFGRRVDGEGFEQYVEYGRALGMEVVEGPRPEEAGLFEGKPISSSLIRSLISAGREQDAISLM